MTTVSNSRMRVVTFDINEMGQITRKLPKLEREEQLENPLLQGLYPDIRVARLNVPPGRLEAFQEALVENSTPWTSNTSEPSPPVSRTGRKPPSPTSGSLSLRANGASSFPTAA